MVLRMDAPTGSVEGSRYAEYRLLLLAIRAGVTVPAVHYYGDESEGLGGSFIIMDRAGGEALGRRLLRDSRYVRTREVLPTQLAAELARIHAIVLDDTALDCLRSTSSGNSACSAQEGLLRFLEIFETVAGGRAYPVLTLAARWLKARVPALSHPALVHGDFRIGNVMFDEQGLTAVLDWELAHLGDPLEDLGWLAVRAWRFGADAQAVGGLCSREEFARLYGEAAGVEVDMESFRYWEIYGNWKWAVICLMQCARHRAGLRPDLELATIGRRVAETEWEILELLEGV